MKETVGFTLVDPAKVTSGKGQEKDVSKPKVASNRPTDKDEKGDTDKIRIGYFSADFCNHPVMQLIAPLLELHDKSRFKIYLYSFVPKEDELWTETQEQLKVDHHKS